MFTCGNPRAEAREKLLVYIDAMDLEADSRLPSEEKLCALLGVSRTTIRAVLEELIAEGRIIRQKGVRSFVNPAFYKLKALLYPYQPIQKSIRAMGYTPRSRNLRTQIIPATESIASSLRMKPGDNVVRSTHLFYADTHFCALCYDYFDCAILTEEDILRLNRETSSMFQVLFNKAGQKIAWDVLQITVTDTEQTPELISAAGISPERRKAFLVTDGTGYDANNYPVTHSTIYYDTDYISFGVVRKERYDFDDFYSDRIE